jgi:hypothetical protein
MFVNLGKKKILNNYFLQEEYMRDKYIIKKDLNHIFKNILIGTMCFGTLIIMTSSRHIKKLKIYNEEVITKPIEQVIENSSSSTVSSDIVSSSDSVIVSSALPISSMEEKKYYFGNDALIEQYGRFTVMGMNYDDYLRTMDNSFNEIIYDIEMDNDLNYDLKKLYRYIDIEKFLYDLGENNNARLYKLGESSEKRNIYGIEVGTGKNVIMLTGNLHGNEGAGTAYILKGISELLNKSKKDVYIKLLLENVKIVAIPCVNPDGREININKGINTWKANALGINLNGNFPSSEAGCLSYKEKIDSNISSNPNAATFPGYTLGDALETRILMKWYNEYIVNQNARCYVDYHQQGRVVYCTNFYTTDDRNNNTLNFVSDILSFFNNNRISNKFANGGTTTKMDGSGGGGTYYASNLADGLVMSKQYGRLGLNKNNLVQPALLFGKLTENNEFYKPANKSFVTCTLEIGTGDSLGYDQKALLNQEQEYYEYGYENILKLLMERTLAADVINDLKNQANITNNKVLIK